MKVLLACECRKGIGENHYVEVLESALLAHGVDVRSSVLEFWNPTCHYDIVHFQWPEAVSIQGNHPSPVALAALSARINSYKRQGTKLIITRHNDHPHYISDPAADDLYQLVERSCDAILHMSEQSRSSIPRSHCSETVQHFIVPHHIYPTIDRNIPQSDARERLGISSSKKLVLAFGNFRADEERLLVLRAQRRLSHQRVSVLAPRMFQNPITGGGTVAFLREIQHRLVFIRHGFIPHSGGPVTDTKMSLLFAAADVILIPRIVILNSGTLSMGFYFGKVVVGPNRGNVGEILKDTGNPVFDPGSLQSLCNAIQYGLVLSKTGKGEENRMIADEQWHPSIIARTIQSIYKQLLNGTDNQ